MKKTILYTAIVSGLLSAGAIHAAPSFNADFELDTTTVSKSVGDSTYTQSGRVALNVTGEHTAGDNFVSGKGTALIKTDGTTAVDDAFIKFGNSAWDLQAGRFEGANLFPLGKDVVVEHAGGVDVYNAGKARGRAGTDAGQIAFHVNASESVKFELGTIYGDDDADADNSTAVSGIRPVVTIMTDSVTYTAGFESVSYDLTAGGKKDMSGYGLAANFNVGAANVNLAAASSKDDVSDQKVSSLTANMTYGNFGLGLISSSVDNKTGDDPSLLTTYVAYSMPLLDIENASVTFAASHSTADKVAATTNDKTTAARVRFNYNF